MTYEEALKELKHEIDMIPKEPPSDFVGNKNVWFKEHERIIGAHKIAVGALEKQIPNGKWVYHYRLKKFVCLECGYEQKHKPEWNYCPNCGTKMDG